MSRYPNIIFCNLPYAGSSAIDPILRDLLGTLQYDLIPVYPHNADQLPQFLGGERPIYHWSHDPVATYADLMPTGDYKFLYLYRDPRDVVVSMAKDYIHLGYAAGQSEKQILAGKIQTTLPPLLEAACEWLRQDRAMCLPITFEEMKRDIAAIICRIFAFLNLALDDSELAAAVNRHSFENVTGRQRGEEGPTVRTGYMYRKGVSGGWKQHFDVELVEQLKRDCGTYLAELNYEPDNDWAAPSAVVQFALSPYIPVTQALADTLRAAIQSADDESCPEFVCGSDQQAICYPERPTILITGETGLLRSPSSVPGEVAPGGAGQRVEICSAPASGNYRVPDVKDEMMISLTGLPADEAGVYSALCRRVMWQAALESMSVLVVAPQDVAAYPEETMRRILRFLNLSYTASVAATLIRALPKPKGSAESTSPTSSASEELDGLRQTAAQAYAARAESLSTSTIDVLNSAHTCVIGGRPESALASLRCVLLNANLSSTEFLCVLSSHAAIVWVRSIFRDEPRYGSVSGAVLPLFRDLNVYFLARTDIQRALIGALALPSSVEEARIYNRLGEALFGAEEWTGAESALLQGLEQDPASAMLRSNLAVLCWQQGQIVQALAHLEEALRLDPNDHCALQNAAAIVAGVRS